MLTAKEIRDRIDASQQRYAERRLRMLRDQELYDLKPFRREDAPVAFTLPREHADAMIRQLRQAHFFDGVLPDDLNSEGGRAAELLFAWALKQAEAANFWERLTHFTALRGFAVALHILVMDESGSPVPVVKAWDPMNVHWGRDVNGTAWAAHVTDHDERRIDYYDSETYCLVISDRKMKTTPIKGSPEQAPVTIRPVGMLQMPDGDPNFGESCFSGSKQLYEPYNVARSIYLNALSQGRRDQLAESMMETFKGELARWYGSYGGVALMAMQAVYINIEQYLRRQFESGSFGVAHVPVQARSGMPPSARIEPSVVARAPQLDIRLVSEWELARRNQIVDSLRQMGFDVSPEDL